MKIRWIHFSDLHLGDDKAADTRLMRRKLPGYIAGFNQTFEYAFCTGDVKQWDSDYSAAPDYIRSLCHASHTPLDHLFIVPGNHDVERGGNDRTDLIGRITDWGSDYYRSIDGYISEQDYAVLKSGQDNFRTFIAALLGCDRAEKYDAPHFVITTEHLNILHLDTTLTYGDGHERDFVVGTQALMDALDQCDPKLPTIILTHYSYDFLIQSERNQLETILNDYNVQLWIAGHEHEQLIRWQRQKFLECQCGNLSLQKGARSCFLTGELDLETGDGVITVHAWYEGKNWEQYPFAGNGSEDDRYFPFHLRLPGERMTYDVSAELANAREACNRLLAAGGSFSGVSVNPAILTDLEVGSCIFINDEDTLPLTRVTDRLWSDKLNNPELSCNALILGDGGMGKSTMMFHECRRLLSERQLSVYISLQAREGSDNESLLGYILRCLYKAEDDRAKGKLLRLTASMHPHPDLVLFIDGFNELSGEGAQRYVAEIKALSQYPGVQIIVSSRLDFLRDYGLSHFGMIRTCDLRESQIEQLFRERPDDWHQVLAQKNLRILLRNPMMALLYASTCPIVERHSDLDYLDWIMPITNASDLLHDYYMAQIAILVDRQRIDGNHIFECMVAIDRLLPSLAYEAERNNITAWAEPEFDAKLREAAVMVNAALKAALPEKLRRIKRRLRVHEEKAGDLYDLIISEMALLKSGNGRVSFAHQVFRDYLAAAYLHQSQMIVGKLSEGSDAHIGFDAEDCLIAKTGQNTFKWPTIAYDKIENGSSDEIIDLSAYDEETEQKISFLKKRLRESGLEGTIEKLSENGRYLAAGFDSGFIQVWDVMEQDCIANLSLNDSQIAAAAFTRNGKTAALGSGGKIVQIWDMERGKCSNTLYFDQRVSLLRMPVDESTLECQFSDLSYCRVDLRTGERTKVERPAANPFVSKTLLNRLAGMNILDSDIESAPDRNAIILTRKGEAFTWDEKMKKLNGCPGHMGKVSSVAMCTADTRFAASYSPEKYRADRGDGHRRGLLNNQKLVRVRIVKTGQCQWRLPTNGRSIVKLQFFTSNRIILAGFASNGDILLWELINEGPYGHERGHWENVEIVHNNQAEPIECAFPDNKKNFISVYNNGTILVRPFANKGSETRIATIPGIDASVLRWRELKCDDQLKQMLLGYQLML